MIWGICSNYLNDMQQLLCSQVWHDAYMFVAWFMNMCNVTHAYGCRWLYVHVGHDSCMRVTWRNCKSREGTKVLCSHLRCDLCMCVTCICVPCTCVTRLIHGTCLMCDMANGTWLMCDMANMCDMHMCDTAHEYIEHDSCVTWHIHICEMTHAHVWHDSGVCVTWLNRKW